MLRIVHGTHIDFIRHWRKAVIITAAFVLAGMIFLATRGVNQSIEFTGGSLVQVEFTQPPGIDVVRQTVAQSGYPGAEITEFGSPTEFTVRAQPREGEVVLTQNDSTAARIMAGLTARFGADAVKETRSEFVGPRVGAELQRNATIAILISFLVTMIYLAFRFEWRFGLAAVLATAHDVVATIAFIALMHIEVSLTVVAAILTVIGYSLNDTIIIFDRIRENLKKHRKEPLYDIINRSINETLPRSIMTHATTLAATSALLIFGGEVIRPFAWVMTFGIFTGTFSSIYVAGALLLWIERKWPRDTTPETRAGAATRSSVPAPRPERTGSARATR